MSQWNDFEKMIAHAFPGYEKARVANLAMMPVPTRVINQGNGVPMRIQTGKSPFDIYGYALENCKIATAGTMIGCELKDTGHRETSLKIAHDGLRDHQLFSLAELAKAGGIAKIVWQNMGEIAVLDEDEIVLAWEMYRAGTEAESLRKKPVQGCKSIKWEKFREARWVSVGGHATPNWLSQPPKK